MEEEDQVEGITVFTVPPISAIEVMVPNATPVSSIVRNETFDGCHVAKVSPPNTFLTFQVVSTAPPLFAPCALDFAETREPRWSDFWTTWSRGVSDATICSTFGNGQSMP